MRTTEQQLAPKPREKPSPDRRVMNFLRDQYLRFSLPFAIVFLFYNPRIDANYGLTWRRKFKLAWRMYRNTRHVETGSSYKAHLAMAAKLLETSPAVKGVVVECGCWLGGSTANLSLICDLVGRDLIVYDSFEGLPAAEPGDKYASPFGEGYLKGELELVKENVRRYGAIERCQFRKGWFKDTLPSHTEPIVLAYLDVDYQASMHDCVVNLWPRLTDQGYIFMDEYVRIDYCAIFFSERFWKENFDSPPPGLIGSGCGIQVGQYYLGPHYQRPMIQAPASVAFTRRDFYGLWDYVREAEEPS